MYEHLPLITLDDIPKDQVITNGRKSSGSMSIKQDLDNECYCERQDNNLDDDPASDSIYFDDNQKSLDVQEDDDDPENFPMNLGEDDLDIINDSDEFDEEESDDDDEYGYEMENED